MSELKNFFFDFVSEGFHSGWKHIDASLINSDKTLVTDVVIIGSGAGGANAAEILAKAAIEPNPVPLMPFFDVESSLITIWK